MDDLAAAFSGAVGVSFSADSSATQHPRMCMYKARESKQSQWERRKNKLKQQREQRKDYSNIARQLAEEDWANITLSDDEDGMDQSSPSTKGKTDKKKKERYYSNQLMLSEWLEDLPEDMAENWLMVPCPVGKRTFVLASRGKTQHYTKSGFCLNSFQSGLPGGSARQTKNQRMYTILDCIYSDVTRTYWVLDLMCWQGHPVYDSDTEFRFFWLQSKFAENPDLLQGTKKNPVKFCPLPNFRCEKQVLQDAMSQPMPFQGELDGLLFYHKALHYVPGVTPLVGWLKPWMLTEILSVPVPDFFMAKRPPGASLRPPVASASPAKSEAPKNGVMGGKEEGEGAKVAAVAIEASSAETTAAAMDAEAPTDGSTGKKEEAAKVAAVGMEASSKEKTAAAMDAGATTNGSTGKKKKKKKAKAATVAMEAS